MQIRPDPKTRGQTSPCRTPPVTAPPMEAQTKTATQTKGCSPTQKPWAQATRKAGSNPQNLPT